MPRRRKQIDGGNILTPFIRKGFSSASEAVLKRYGEQPIRRIVLTRAPITSIIRKALNFISFGKFDEYFKSQGFDNVFHLAMVCEIGDARIVVEKNATVNISTGFQQKEDTQFKEVPLKGHTTLSDMLSKAALVMGQDFWTYNAFTNNCQVFIDTILKTNGLLTPDIHNWLFQSIPELEKELGFASHIVNAVTDIGAVANTITGKGTISFEAIVEKHCQKIEGAGLKRKAMRKRKARE